MGSTRALSLTCVPAGYPVLVGKKLKLENHKISSVWSTLVSLISLRSRPCFELSDSCGMYYIQKLEASVRGQGQVLDLSL